MTSSLVPETTAPLTNGALERTAAFALAEQERASIQARHTVALARPRSMKRVHERLMDACQRPRFAESALYKKRVGWDYKENCAVYAVDLSIRFAEAVYAEMGNVLSDAKVVHEDENVRIVRVIVSDLETNATYSSDVPVKTTVERKRLKKGQIPIAERVNSYGEMVYIVPATDDEMAQKTNALVSKALRNNILRLVPADIKEEARDVILQTQKEQDAKNPQASTKRIIEAFRTVGVAEEDVLSYLGKSLDKLDASELADLRALYSGIKEGETTWGEQMELRKQQKDNKKRPSSRSQRVKDSVGKSGKGRPARRTKKADQGAAPARGAGPAESTDDAPRDDPDRQPDATAGATTPETPAPPASPAEPAPEESGKPRDDADAVGSLFD